MNSVFSKLILAAGLAAIMAVLASAASIGSDVVRLAVAAEKASDAETLAEDETADESPQPPIALAQVPPPAAAPGSPPMPLPFAHGMFGAPSFGPPPFGAPPSPRAACEDRIAHEAAHRTYLRIRLAPTGEQAAAFERFERAASIAAERQGQFCATLPAIANASPPDLPVRLEFVERELGGRLEALRATRGALAALWETLTPGQRSLFDRPPLRPF